MKSYFSIVLLMVTLVTNAQIKLSKEETIKYIKDKIGETHGHQIIWKTGPAHFAISTTFHESGKGIYFKYENGLNNYLRLSSGNLWYDHTFEFNPEQILNVVDGSSNTTSASPVGFITIDFSSNLVKKDIRNWSQKYPNTNIVDEWSWINTIAEKGNVSHVYLPYLKQDPLAFERLKKAILHLKTLYVKVDPFAN